MLQNQIGTQHIKHNTSQRIAQHWIQIQKTLLRITVQCQKVKDD